MAWISVGERMPGEGDKTPLLVVYLQPSFGVFSAESTVGYFDRPENYENPADAGGWLDWHTGNKILVTHWQPLPELPASRFDDMEQLAFERQFGSFRPNLGSVSEGALNEG